jgi:hypothetical protein
LQCWITLITFDELQLLPFPLETELQLNPLKLSVMKNFLANEKVQDSLLVTVILAAIVAVTVLFI